MKPCAPALLLTSIGPSLGLALSLSLAAAAAAATGCDQTPQPPVRRSTGPGGVTSADATARPVPSPPRPPRPGVRARPAPPEPTGVLTAADLHWQIVRVPAKEHRWRWGEGRRLLVRGEVLKRDAETRELWLDTGRPGNPLVAAFPDRAALEALGSGPDAPREVLLDCRFVKVITGQVWLADCRRAATGIRARPAPPPTRRR